MKIMKIVFLEKERIQRVITIWCTHIFLMPQAMKIPVKAAVDKDWEKLDKILAWQLTRVRNKKRVNAEATKEGKTVHFTSPMDICHLKNSELEPKFQKYKGRVVLRGDIVKDDSGAYTSFTEQGSSASQMTAAKWRTVQGCGKFQSQNGPDIWIRPTEHK